MNKHGAGEVPLCRNTITFQPARTEAGEIQNMTTALFSPSIVLRPASTIHCPAVGCNEHPSEHAANA